MQASIQNVKTYFLLFFILSLPLQISAQQQDTTEIVLSDTAEVILHVKQLDKGPIVKGVVIDASTGLPLSGINVTIPEYSSAITDDDGLFSINVPSSSATLIVTGEGYQEKEAAIKGMDNVKIHLYEENFNSIYEVAYLPTRIEPKSHVANAVTSLTMQNKLQTPSETPENYFQGKVPGLSMTRRSGAPGMGVTMFMRGFNSINATNQPLVIVDGMIYDMNNYAGSLINGYYSNPLQDIDVKDIENITFIKDATAIYGSKASNGVILITTNHAQELATKIDFSMYTGVNFAPANIPVMKSDDYRLYLNDVLKSKGNSDDYIQAQPYMTDDSSIPGYYKYHNNTNWQNEIFRGGYSKNVAVKVTGGDNIAKYAFSMGYLSNDGIVKRTSLNRYNIRFNADLNMSPKLTVNTNLAFTHSEHSLVDQGVANKTNPIYLSLVKAPFLSRNDISDDGIASPNLAGVDIFGLSNPAQVVRGSKTTNKNYRFFGSVNFDYKFSKHIRANSIFGTTYDKVWENFFIPRSGVTPDTLANAIGFSRMANQVQRLFQIYSDTKLSYNKTFYTKHTIAANLGVRYIKSKSEVDVGRGFNSATDELQTIGTGVNTLRQAGGVLGEWRWLNYYAVLDYQLMSKYFISFNMAVDGSSRFGQNNKYGTFSSLAAAWLISSENFMSTMTAIEMLKLRVSYGITGNDDIGNYSAKQTYVSQNLLGRQGIVVGNLGNSSLRWETVKKLNAGVDLSLFDERITLSVDVYKNTISNMLVYEETPTITGLIGQIPTNNGGMQNTGVDIGLSGRILKGPFRWDMGLNIMMYKNKVTRIPNDVMISSYGGATMITQVGSTLGLFYGYKTNGVYSSDEEAANDGKNIQLSNGVMVPFKGGDVRFMDLNGDGIIDERDRTVIGNTNPDFTGMFSNHFEWKKFALDAMFSVSYGNKVYDYDRSQLESVSGTENQTIKMGNRWRTNGQITDVPKATWGDPMGNGRFSDRWIEDGSYVRLRSLSLIYNMSINSGFVKNSSIYITGNNLFTFTNYLGYDPEFSASNSPLAQGINTGIVPQYKSILIGVRLGL